ncbi:hypothetical protein EG68_03610 [Paragonimus skrjabini miyazakii]|uniref:Uncharacterized protein n=1 Tax=Paragonimus skrjabini miyazakii TaxID=59628 RepID=A0A8S9Z2D1_9TREM|nr:hypothetical protein EG68_03610 [Paragonimus skrjabini miyazakii]
MLVKRRSCRLNKHFLIPCLIMLLLMDISTQFVRHNLKYSHIKSVMSHVAGTSCTDKPLVTPQNSLTSAWQNDDSHCISTSDQTIANEATLASAGPHYNTHV